jgi:hypothetical protein
MKTLFLLLVVILLPGFGKAQQYSFLDYIKDSDTQTFWAQNNADCDHYFLSGSDFRLIRKNGVRVAIAPDYWNGYTIYIVSVRNEGEGRIDVISQDVSLAAWKHKDDSLKMEPTPVTQIPADAVLNKMERAQAWRNAFAGIGAAMATQKATVSDQSGTTLGTVTTPDYEARNRAAQNAANASESVARQAAVVSDMSLKSETLVPGAYVTGIVFFKLKTNGAQVFTVKINGMNYRFLHAYKDAK